MNTINNQTLIDLWSYFIEMALVGLAWVGILTVWAAIAFVRILVLLALGIAIWIGLFGKGKKSGFP